MKMNNKKAEQEAQRQQVKIERMASKRRNRALGNSLVRDDNALVEKPKILIICEGENTEPSYFNQFKMKTAEVKAIGEGYNTISLVERAKYWSEKADYDQIWCVFDKDDFSDNDFNKAIIKSESYGFHVAFSNQAFEYWLILHLNDHQGCSIHRDSYNRMINDCINKSGIKYNGNSDKKVSEDFFSFMLVKDKFINKRAIKEELI